MYERILLPTDGSPGTEKAAEQAIELAREFDATLDVLHVYDPGVLPLDQHSETMLTKLEEEGRRWTERLVVQARDAGVESVSGTVVQGTPHQAILDFVADHDSDLIVMGTHGRTGLRHYLLGSVTERVVRAADVPVLTVSLGESAPTE
ncbi:MAG: universal stress protein [Halobacteriota archaeon]